MTPTPGSVFQLTGLIEGRFDIAITLIDNVVAYREGQGEVPIAGPDLFAFMAADTRVFPTLVTQAEVTSYADLRGRTLSVDAMSTGYALVLAAMLDHGGLKPGEYRLDSVGGAQERYLALSENKHAGCLLNSPFEGLLRARGFNVLDTAIAVLGKYQGQVGAARKSWAVANREAVVGFIRAFMTAVRWLHDPAHCEEAFGIYRRHTRMRMRTPAPARRRRPTRSCSIPPTAFPSAERSTPMLWKPSSRFARNTACRKKRLDGLETITTPAFWSKRWPAKKAEALFKPYAE